MKKTFISLMVAAMLVLGTVGSAVAVTAHNHECGHENEICRHQNEEQKEIKVRWACVFCGYATTSPNRPTSPGKCRYSTTGRHVYEIDDPRYR